MAQQLSTATEQQIWHLCQRLEFFAYHLPLSLQKLATSSTNDNYYIHTQRGHYLLRHYAPFVGGVCRQQELRCQHAAAAVEVTPAARFRRNSAWIRRFGRRGFTMKTG